MLRILNVCGLVFFPFPYTSCRAVMSLINVYEKGIDYTNICTLSIYATHKLISKCLHNFSSETKRLKSVNFCFWLMVLLKVYLVWNKSHDFSFFLFLSLFFLHLTCSFLSQINRFHAEKQKRREEQRKRDMKRLAELRKEIEEQMQKDKER